MVQTGAYTTAWLPSAILNVKVLMASVSSRTTGLRYTEMSQLTGKLRVLLSHRVHTQHFNLIRRVQSVQNAELLGFSLEPDDAIISRRFCGSCTGFQFRDALTTN